MNNQILHHVKKSERKGIKHYIIELKIAYMKKKKVYIYHFVLIVTYKHLSEKYSNKTIIFFN